MSHPLSLGVCCHQCITDGVAVSPFGDGLMWPMVLCPRCGNKRCPKAEDHRFACTNSNELGQVGAVGEDAEIPPAVRWGARGDD